MTIPYSSYQESGQRERWALDLAKVVKLAELGELSSDVVGIRPQRLKWLVRQAAL